MFDENTFVGEKADLLEQFLSAKPLGECVGYAEIELVVDCSRRFQPDVFWAIVNKVRKSWLERETGGRGCVLEAIKRRGLRLMLPAEQVLNCAERRFSKMRRQAKRGVKEIVAVESSDLTPTLCKARMQTLKQLTDKQDELRQSQREIGTVRKTETIPLRYVPPKEAA